MNPLPKEIQDHIQQGGQDILDGYVRFIPQRDIAAVREILEASALWKGFAPFAITAFADVFAWDAESESFWLYRLVDGTAHVVLSGPKYFFMTVKYDDELQDALFDLSLYREARKKLGVLQPDECYIFEPVPALGGSKDMKSLNKGLTLPYLGILCSLT